MLVLVLLAQCESIFLSICLNKLIFFFHETRAHLKMGKQRISCSRICCEWAFDTKIRCLQLRSVVVGDC